MGKDNKKKFHRKNNKRDENKSSEKKTKGQIPIDKLKFATGDNQIENFDRLNPG